MVYNCTHGFFFFSSRRRHTRFDCDWSSDVCSSDLAAGLATHNCYARPTHEYLGFSAGLDFERRIMVKEDAPALLRQTLASRRWEPQVVALSGNTDCYQPVERRLEITRRCLEVFAEFRNPVSAITKSALVARDADLFAELVDGLREAEEHPARTLR